MKKRKNQCGEKKYENIEKASSNENMKMKKMARK